MTLHPNYSGRWRFDAEASVLQIARPDAVVFAIEHREPSFHLERTLEFGDRRDVFAIDLTIGAAPAPIARGDATIFPRAFWDHDELVFDTQIQRAGNLATNLVRYRLEKNGLMLVAEERFRSPGHDYDNTWVFAKEPES